MSDEITQGQEALGKAIEHARAGEDKQLAQRVRELGESFVRLMNGLVRLRAIHAPDNHAFDEPTSQLVTTLHTLEQLIGQVMIVCVEGQVYVNDIRVRMDERLSGPAELEAELGRHSCGGLSFAKPLSGSQVRVLSGLIAADAADDRPLHALNEALRQGGLADVTASGRYRLRLSGEADRTASQVELQKTLQRASGVIADAWDGLANERVPNPLPVRKLVNEFVDASGEEDLLAVEESFTTGAGGSAFAKHSLRTTTFSLMIGRELGLSAAQLADLGVSAMYHDCGYASKEDGFAVPFAHHGHAGVRALLKQRGFHQAKIKRLLVSLEHHREMVGHFPRPSLYARMVRIADDFDNYTRLRPEGALMSPAEALVRMASVAGTSYDPHLFQLFVNKVGAFPPGTLLRLKDGRVVISVSGARDPARFSRPLCRVLRNADGRQPETDQLVDTAVPGVLVAEVLLQKRSGG
ncbi:MAG: HD domain-containing protein [Deltaproteobacteria bacterium]|nr:HD domain-containing protein [Deltaproteobacteria bacterium]